MCGLKCDFQNQFRWNYVMVMLLSGSAIITGTIQVEIKIILRTETFWYLISDV